MINTGYPGRKRTGKRTRSMRKAGKLAMTTVVLKKHLHIPEDTNVRDIWLDHERDIAYILIEDGEWLPDTPEGQEPMQVVVPLTD